MRAVFAWASLLLTSCGPPEPPDAGPPDSGRAGPALAEGAVVALRHRYPLVTDASFSDGRLILVVRDRSRWSDPVPSTILVSDDEGRSFRSVEVEGGCRDLPQVAVHRAGSSSYIVGVDGGAVLSGGGNVCVAPLDLETGTAGESPVWLGPWPVRATGTTLSGVRLGDRGTSLHVDSFDLASGERSSAMLPGPTEPCEWAFDPDPDGRWSRFCYALDQRCADDLQDIGDAAVRRRCTSERDWPVPETTPQEQVALPSGIWLAYYEGGHTYALRAMEGDELALTSPVDLGPGILANPSLDFMRPRWGGLLRLEPPLGASGGRRFVELSSDGTTRDLPVRRSPCRDEAACEDSLEYLVPLGDGRWLSVYALPASESDSDDFDVITRVSELDGALPTITEGGEPVHRWPREAVRGDGPLERACARVSSCFIRVSMQACIDYWMRVRTADPAADEAFRRFVETPAGCDGFADTYAEWVLPTLSPCEEGCHGEVALLCDGMPSPRATDCRLRGSHCQADPSSGRPTCGDPSSLECDVCDGARAAICATVPVPQLLDCGALGLTCYLNAGVPACAAEGETTCAGTFCDGSIASACESGRTVLQRSDCARLSLPCRGGVCDITDDAGRSCDAIGGSTSCAGDLLVYCAGRQRRYVDCKDVGFATCRELSDGPPSRAACEP